MPEVTVGVDRIKYDTDPDHCPICHYGILPQAIGLNYIKHKRFQGDTLELVYRCPRNDCQHAFIGEYKQARDFRVNLPDGPFLLRSTSPFYPKAPEIPEQVAKISPLYADIFKQSSAAEVYRLDQIAGVGYRKALEFLVKDFAIDQNPDQAEQIKGKFLANCIKDHVNDANTQECAKRAAWIGNDETHYVREWEAKDISDLKILIKLTEGWILNHLLTKKYLEEMKPD